MAIIDIQCILGVNNKYFIKEMSIVDIESLAIQHWIFKHTSIKQDTKSQSVNRWLMRYYHEIPLEYGDVDYGELNEILKSLKFDCIYVKGLQKQQILQKFISNITIINLEDLECPRLNQLQTDNTLPRCIYHKDSSSKQCTLYKVFALHKWLVNKL
ncbi:uncharacterized protein LOC112691143 [Sipha flava]|jgi:hypothetical protein|uniref:Uncharacterized protein LOC112691143 n=1 Tax=Sipha flava TaxID=143950 RepID=A0A2S2QCX3_9HEMI|nr:uncharacterized protein LOC112691143 [Sipha flava]